MPFGLCGQHNVTEEITVRIELLDNSVLQVVLSKDAKGLECLEKVAEKLGITEVNYFGLQYVNKRGRDWWLILDKSIRKQLERHRLNGCRNITLKFRVYFFVSDFTQLREEVTRYHYYLQLKAYILEKRLSTDEETAVLLASYSAQAEFGDLNEEQHTDYVRDYVLLPQNLIFSLSEEKLNQQIINKHRCHKGMSSQQAEEEYIKVVQKLEGYGDEYYPVKDKDGFLLLLGASFLGIVVRHPHGLPPVYFRWPDIIKISHSKKYFNIETTKMLDTIQFEMEDSATAKYAWKMFVQHHQFCRLNITSTPGEVVRSRAPTSRSMMKERTVTLSRRSRREGSQQDMLMMVDRSMGSTVSVPGSSGMVNPVFSEGDDEENTNSIDTPCVTTPINGDDVLSHRPFPAETHGEPSSRPASVSLLGTRTPREAADTNRPASVDLPLQPIRNYPLHNSFSGSQNQNGSLLRDSVSSDLSASRTLPKNHRQEFGKTAALEGKANSVAAGSSLSVDSGHPHGVTDLSYRTQSFESLDEVQSGRTSAESIPASQSRPIRPTSLNLESAADDVSVVTGHTSGYSTSTDSGLDDRRDDLEEMEQEERLSREEQLTILEKVLTEGQVFTEFQKIEMKLESYPVTTAELEVNTKKNRYKDVLPYEETRVHLNQRHSASSSDYINASYIKMKVGGRQYSYIAAQGPTEETTSDFWQMIWEQNVKVVVMATEDNATTNPKNSCHRYWPEDARGATTTFGSFQIRTDDVRDASPFKVRCLQVEHVPSKTCRSVHHLQFTAWPDHGVPKESKDFLEFLEELESLRQRSNSGMSHHQEPAPIVVHCTAGVGRTGVILLSDLMIACLQNNQRINIPRTLIRLRRQRMLLVANYGQYRFVYTTVIQYIKSSRLI